MRQSDKLDYACGVVAGIHAILNNLDKIKLKENSVLAKFFEVTKNLTPNEKAYILEENEEFKVPHKIYAA